MRVANFDWNADIRGHTCADILIRFNWKRSRPDGAEAGGGGGEGGGGSSHRYLRRLVLCDLACAMFERDSNQLHELADRPAAPTNVYRFI